jgi:hypothetical protein
MKRVLHVVAREQPLLMGYLMTNEGARPSKELLVEIKLDERRGERRLSSEARDPERRSGERRLRPSLDPDLRSRGYATVVQSEVGPSWTAEAKPQPAMAWRPRSTWGQRAARAGRRRSRVWWGLVVVLLAVVGGSTVVVRSIRGTPAPPPPAPQAAPQIEKAPPPPPASKAEPVGPAAPPLPPSRPAPGRVVSTRSSGVVLSVDPRTRTLVLEDRGAAAAGRLRVELAPDARVVLSERDDQAEDPSRPFKDTVISLSDVRRGDYVVVEVRGPEGKELGHSVVVTFRPH